MKHYLRRVIGKATLTYKEMATFLSEVEACLNSRPLQALSDDPDDLNKMPPPTDSVAGSCCRRCEITCGSGGHGNMSRDSLLGRSGGPPPII